MRPAQCPDADCVHRPVLIETAAGYQAHCPGCFDPAPDSGELSRLVGQGATRAETASEVAGLAALLANAAFRDRLERWDLDIQPSDHHWAALNNGYPGNADADDSTPIDELFETAFACRLSQLWADTLARRVRLAACGHEVSRRPLFPVGDAL